MNHIKRQDGQGSRADVSNVGVVVEIANQYTVERGMSGNRGEIEQAMQAANERFKADLIDDFSNGGRIYQTIKERG